MYDHRSFVLTALQFTEKLVSDYDVNTVLEDLAVRLAELLSLAGSGVSVAVEGRLRAVTTIPPHLADLEHHQEQTQSGPCADAFRTGHPVTVVDLQEDERWPEYREVALRLGMRAVVGLPMKLGDRIVGALNLYNAEVRPWEEDDLIAAQLLANLATSFLIQSESMNQQSVLNAQLQRALESRVLVEQAKGVLAEAHGTDVTAAFERIRRHARQHNVKVVEVAQGIVHLGLRL
ncbi:GAF and ANTAR domain-containing protein [Pseudactinotalea terrae]|uniref:GAF and ANTAR domain-containing protein n=1 Tax=Pseudactinotalea terrae TaxID=1743262 RepID=UPI0012E1D6BA|nr:GAF and ANTAR domain-containing protein [Pseudactinotalea terrae]